jgi:PAS domain S-box-containing protein
MRSSLRLTLWLGVTAIAVAVVLLSLVVVVSLNQLGSAVATILRENYGSVIACEDMKEALEREDSAAQFAASGHEEIAVPQLRNNRQAFDQAFTVERNNVTLPGEGDLVHNIDVRYREYQKAIDVTLALPLHKRHAAYFSDLLPQFLAIKDDIQSVLRMNQENMEQADRAAKLRAKRTAQVALAASVAAVLFVGWFAWWLPRVILRPVMELTRTVQAIGEGNLNVKVDPPGVAELLPLADGFNKMLERLRAYRESSLGELLAAKDLARATLECMLDPVVVCDESGGIRLANEVAETAFGLSVGSSEELAAVGVVTPEALATARDQVLGTGKPVLPKSLSEAMHWRSADGERYYLVRAAPLRTGRKEERAVIVVAQDVTRFHRIDELKSDMVATVSHQFKTPLTALRMATHLLLDAVTGPLTDSQRELVTTAKEETERLRSMVEDLLDVVRIESEAGALHRVPVEPVGLLCEVVDAHRTVARERGVILEVEASVPQGKVSVDPERMSIALSNLVSNAIRHSPSGRHVSVGAARDSGSLRIHVTDHGEGIAPDDLKRLFDRSATANNGPPSSHTTAQGSSAAAGPRRHGLGLTIAREVVLSHGGELLVESKPGEGSTFTIVLPVEQMA